MAQPLLVVDGHPVTQVVIADNIFAGARGMLFRRVLPEALLLRPGSSVHGMGMRVPLDVAQLSVDMRVLGVYLLQPWGKVGSRSGVTQVLEAPAGNFERWGLKVGSALELRQGEEVPHTSP